MSDLLENRFVFKEIADDFSKFYRTESKIFLRAAIKYNSKTFLAEKVMPCLPYLAQPMYKV